MALVYKRSTKNAARRYERSSGMEPNPGVNALTVVNPGKPPHRNPFQWISGRGQRHIHQSRAYETLDGAKRWKNRAKDSNARLYPVDERGTIVSRPIPSSLLQNGPRRNEMAYNIGALRRAMRANMSPEDREAIKAAARGIDTGRPAAKPRKTTAPKAAAKPKKASKPKAAAKPKKASKPKAAAKPKKAKTKKSTGAGTSATVSKKGAKIKAAGRKSTRGGKRRSKGRKGSRKFSRYFRNQPVRLTGRSYIDKYLMHGVLPTVTRLGRSSFSRSGRPYILTYPIPGGAYGRLSKKRMSVRGGGRRGYAVGASYRGRRARRMPGDRARRRRRLSANRRHSRRHSRRRVSRNPRYVVVNRRRSRRRGSRRSVMGLYANKRRRSKRRHSLRRNMLAVSKLRYQGRGRARIGKPSGRSYQLVEFGSKSKKYKKAGYPVMVPPSVSLHSYVRKFTFGGAAKDAHARAKTAGYKERKKYARSRKLGKNRRKSMRRNPKYVVVNRRGRRGRRVRRNFLGALGRIDWMNDVVTPVAAGTAGFVAARVLSNSLANVDALRNSLDSGASAADAKNTKLAANAVGIVATLGLATQVPMIRRYQGALVTGMGLALADRLIQRFGSGTPFVQNYLSGFGEYVNQPLSGFGEYVNQPLSGGIGEYVNQPLSGGIGEYVNQPMNGLGTMYATAGLGTMYATAGYPEGADPANQAGVDGLMDTMEAAAGVGAFEAAAGVGTMYATAGLGATMGAGEADASLAAMYAKMQPPWASIQTPTDLAQDVTKDFPYDKQVKESLVTPEGKGYAGGLFSRHLFAGMMGS